MVVKTIFMLSVYFIPLLFINLGIISSPWLLYTLYIIAGLGMSGIGMGIMHDAIHGSYSKNKSINKFLGLSINLIGANASVWRIQHNVLHHTYTNIDSLDDDINPPFFLRFSPHAKHYWVHQFQHIYIWLFYGLSTLSWVTAKDFIRLPRYKNMGYLQGKNEMRNELLNSIGWKLLHYTITLGLPIIMVPLAPWITILAFVSMHFVTGIFISIVFQTAHVMPGNEYPLPDKNGLIASNWSVHQLATTCNFSPKSSSFSWLIGGLNYQIEHHLFPNICHVHYKKISVLVAETAKEYGINYQIKKNFAIAIWDHIKMLKQLGKLEIVPETVQKISK